MSFIVATVSKDGLILFPLKDKLTSNMKQK